MSNTNEILSSIQLCINDGNYKSAANLFEKLIKHCKEVSSPEISAIYYEYGMFLFDIGDYALSVPMLILAYEGNFRKEDIISLFYTSFIYPNEEEFLDAYITQIEQVTPHLADHLPEYEKLAIDFIPVSDTEYFIFDKCTLSFEGFINIAVSEANNLPLEDEFTDITLISHWNISKNHNYVVASSNRTLYYITEDMSKLLSFFKIPKIRENYLNHVYFFENAKTYQDFFHTNKSLYLPQIVFGADSLAVQNINSINQQEHSYRITKEGRDSGNILLSVCIPSFDRGGLALSRVQNLLTLSYDAEIEIIVSNNGSILGAEDYRQIANIKDSRIIYHEFKENQGPSANWLKTIELSHGRFSLFLSDEDDIIASNLPHYLNVLKSHPEIGALRSGTEKTYYYQETGVFKKGKNAFMEAFLRNNYLTGIIYKTELFDKYNFFQLDIDYIENKSYWYYPHLWWDSILALSYDYYQDSVFLCKEGENITVKQEEQYKKAGSNEAEKKVDSSMGNMFRFSKYEARLQQHLGFVCLINYLSFSNIEMRIFAYLALCIKTKSLLSLVKPKYIQHGYSFVKVKEDYYNTCIHGMDLLTPPLACNIKIQMTKTILSYTESL